MTIESLQESLRPVTELLAKLDLTDPASCRQQLERDLPLSSPEIRTLRQAAEAGAAAEWLLRKEAGGIRFGRVAKDLDGFSVDAVLMSGPGPRHRHPNGEIDLMFARSGAPNFDGQPEGWHVYGPDSAHVPTVADGEMLILYFLPGGAIEWL